MASVDKVPQDVQRSQGSQDGISAGGDYDQSAKGKQVDDQFAHPQNENQQASSSFPSTEPKPGSSENTKSSIPMTEREMIHQNAAQLIEDLNSKRKHDAECLQEYKAALLEQVEKQCNHMEQCMYDRYDQQNPIVQEKLQELYACLDRIGQLENEMGQFKDALAMLYQDMSNQ